MTSQSHPHLEIRRLFRNAVDELQGVDPAHGRDVSDWEGIASLALAIEKLADRLLTTLDRVPEDLRGLFHDAVVELQPESVSIPRAASPWNGIITLAVAIERLADRLEAIEQRMAQGDSEPSADPRHLDALEETYWWL
jgi:hypothetical protein